MQDIHDGVRVLQPESVSFSRSRGGVLEGVLHGKSYKELVVYRTFPFRYPSRYLSIRTPEGEELGIIDDIAELDGESRQELSLELEFRYFLPRVERVERVDFQSDLWIWELQTHLGPTRLVMRNLHEHLQYAGGNRIVLTDQSGKRCEIPDWRRLDAHSRRQLSELL
ncbi:DUF1854 domain-containing protein [Paenibacillus daejeonensis]|uniref:DUF1854 domain-containing protein n=1 Tax=Paenibacillus daejeonensis TaxID=135193 RepID=UPI00036930C1|nr:DUF1854 domain-containing protein [Paenibacillus daejeonensis]